MLPVWLANELPSKCQCGWDIVDNDNLTARHCRNPICPYHMGVRIEKLAKALNIVGVGEKTALNIALTHKFYTHLQAIPHLTSEKPTVRLEDLPKLIQIDGVDKVFEPYLKGKCDLEEAIASMPPDIAAYAPYLRDGARYVNIQQSETRAGELVNVMITGELKGWSSRGSFLDYLNQRFGQYIQFRDCGVRKTNVFCLIKEHDTPMHSKTQIALSRGILIVTPAELLAQLINKFEGDDTNDASAVL